MVLPLSWSMPGLMIIIIIEVSAQTNARKFTNAYMSAVQKITKKRPHKPKQKSLGIGMFVLNAIQFVLVGCILLKKDEIIQWVTK